MVEVESFPDLQASPVVEQPGYFPCSLRRVLADATQDLKVAEQKRREEC